MVYSLAFSLPGTPVLFYGEEIGMAENLEIEGRYAVRAPMQWSPDGGFTTAEQPRRPMVEGEWGPQRVNVADQRRDPGSLLNWFERLIRRRRECPELGFGTLTRARHRRDAVLAHRCDWEGATIVAVHELAGKPVTVAAAASTTASSSSTCSRPPRTRSRRRWTSSRTPPTGSGSAATASGSRRSRASRRGRAACRTGAGRAWSGGRCGRRPAGGSSASRRPGARARSRLSSVSL